MAVCLLAFWLVATHHCALEAAGLFDSHAKTEHAGCTGGEDHCAHDGCELVEDGGYRAEDSAIKVLSPQLSLCLTTLVAELAAPRPPVRIAPAVAEQIFRPMEWVPAWHFVRRAAAPAHAPDSLSA